MKQISAAVLAVVWIILFTLPVSAADSVYEQDEPVSTLALAYDFENQDLEGILAQFREEYGLTEHNFSMSCYVTGTQELVSFAGDTFRVAASTYKLPLNMVYYDMERSGEISSTAYISGYYLPTMHYETIVNSDNDMAIAMLYHLGSFRQYREIMTQYCDQEYPSAYYADNNINSDYMLAVLWTLYCNSGDYPELLENMKKAAAGQYFQLYQGEYEIAHKYGYYEAAVNDVGIIYTPEPVLVAAYTENVGDAEAKLGHLAELLTEYSLYHTNLKLQAEAEAAAAEEENRLAAEEAQRAEEEARIAAEEAAAEEENRIPAGQAETPPEQTAGAEPAPTPEAPEEAAAKDYAGALMAVVGTASVALMFVLGSLSRKIRNR